MTLFGDQSRARDLHQVIVSIWTHENDHGFQTNVRGFTCRQPAGGCGFLLGSIRLVVFHTCTSSRRWRDMLL